MNRRPLEPDPSTLELVQQGQPGRGVDGAGDDDGGGGGGDD